MPRVDPTASTATVSLVKSAAASSTAGPMQPVPEEIAYYEEELQELLGEVQKGLDGLRRLAAAAKSEKLVELNNRLQRAKQVLHSYRVELRDLPRDRVAEFDIKAREYHQQLQAMHGQLQSAQQDAERAQVGVRTLDEMTTEEVLQEAGRVQDSSLGALGRMKQQIAQTREVGAATSVQLKVQTDQLKNIDADIMKVKSNLQRADLLIRAFVRKIMTDKIIMVFMLSIFIGVIVIIIIKVVNPDGGNGDDEPPDQVEGALSRRLEAFWAVSRRARSARLEAPS